MIWDTRICNVNVYLLSPQGCWLRTCLDLFGPQFSPLPCNIPSAAFGSKSKEAAQTVSYPAAELCYLLMGAC